MKTIEQLYKEWCRETNRAGGVLVQGSIQEFFKWLDSKHYKLVRVVKEIKFEDTVNTEEKAEVFKKLLK